MDGEPARKLMERLLPGVGASPEVRPDKLLPDGSRNAGPSGRPWGGGVCHTTLCQWSDRLCPVFLCAECGIPCGEDPQRRRLLRGADITKCSCLAAQGPSQHEPIVTGLPDPATRPGVYRYRPPHLSAV